MTKALITEKSLIDVINAALRRGWAHKDYLCEVSALRKVDHQERNWEVDQTSLSGSNLLHAEECQRLLDRILNDLVVKYDVQWPT